MNNEKNSVGSAFGSSHYVLEITISERREKTKKYTENAHTKRERENKIGNRKVIFSFLAILLTVLLSCAKISLYTLQKREAWN